MKKLIVLILTISFLFPLTSFAHPGRTDSNGCHVCKTKCTEKWGLEYGEYHCHDQQSKTVKKEAKRTAK